MKKVLLVMTFALALHAWSATDTNRLARLYEEGIQAYWSGDLRKAALAMADIVNQSPQQGLGGRAAYMLGILEEKLGSEEAQALQQEIRKRYPATAAFLDARAAMTNIPPDAGFAAMVNFATIAPSPLWQTAALTELFSRDWSDDVISLRLEAAGLLSDMARESGFDGHPQRLQRLRQQLIRQYGSRSDTLRLISMTRQVLDDNPTPDNMAALVRLYRSTGRPVDAYACFTSTLARTTDPGAIGATMVRTLMDAGDLAQAQAALTEAQQHCGTTNTNLRIAEARLLERNFDFRGALRLLAEGNDPELRREREELRLRIPANYELAWNINLTNALDILVDSNDCLQVLVSDLRNPLGIKQVNARGDVDKQVTLPQSSPVPFPTALSDASIPFNILPDGNFLIGYTRYSPRGEFVSSLERGDGLFLGPGITAAVSPTEGIIIAGMARGLSRYTLDGTLVYTGRRQEPLIQLSSATWSGTNIVLLCARDIILCDGEGQRIRSISLFEGGRDPGFTRGIFSARGRARSDRAGLIYIASPTFSGVRVLDRNFNFVCHIPMENTQACAVDSTGVVYMLHGSQIARFDPLEGGARKMAGID